MSESRICTYAPAVIVSYLAGLSGVTQVSGGIRGTSWSQPKKNGMEYRSFDSAGRTRCLVDTKISSRMGGNPDASMKHSKSLYEKKTAHWSIGQTDHQCWSQMCQACMARQSLSKCKSEKFSYICCKINWKKIIIRFHSHWPLRFCTCKADGTSSCLRMVKHSKSVCAWNTKKQGPIRIVSVIIMRTNRMQTYPNTGHQLINLSLS